MSELSGHARSKECPSRPLRIGALVDGLVTASWVGEVLARIAGSSHLQLVMVIADAQRRAIGTRTSSYRTFLWRLYSHLDYWYYRRKVKTDSLAHVDIGPTCAGVPVVQTGATTSRAAPGAEPDLVRAAASDLDVLLDLRQCVQPPPPTNLANYGTWTFHTPDRPRYGGGPPGFWEIARRSPVSEATLEIRRDDWTGVIYRSLAANDCASVYRNANAAYWRLASVVVQRLESLSQHHWQYVEQLASRYQARTARVQGLAAPANTQTVLVLMRKFLRGARRVLREALCTRDWRIGMREKTWTHVCERPPGHFRTIASPRGRFYADPFLFERNGTTHVFFEDYSHAERKAVISCAPVLPGGDVGPAQVVLAKEYHLSYPYVFDVDGQVYLIPETSQNRTIELYRAVEFPRQWALARVLMRDIHAVDATVFEQSGKFWMFASVGVDGTSDWDHLYLFFASSLLDDWTPHPMNPVVSDARRARPAGRLFWDGGTLVRPAQDCSAMYGSAITLNRVDVLSETDYQETAMGRIAADWLPGGVGTHTISLTGTLEVVDGRRWVLRPTPRLAWPRSWRGSGGPGIVPASADGFGATQPALAPSPRGRRREVG